MMSQMVAMTTQLDHHCQCHYYSPIYNLFWTSAYASAALLVLPNLYVTGMKKVQKRDDKAWNLHNFWYIWHGCWQMCRQTMAVLPCMHSGFPTKIMEQTIVMSLYDVMRFSHVTEGGKYKRRA